MKYLLLSLISILLLISCDPHSEFSGCSYEYPVNAINLKASIKTTDTIWIINDIDAKICLDEGIYKNGVAEENPIFYVLKSDSFVYFKPILVGEHDTTLLGGFYSIKMKYDNGRYKSKYGIVFSTPGVYSLSNFGGLLQNGKDNSHPVLGYFNEETNNQNLFSANVKIPSSDIGISRKYNIYFLQVVR